MNKAWLKAALVRMLRTVAQAALGVIGGSALTIGEVNWLAVISTAALAGIVSFLMSLAGLPEVKEE